VWREILGTEAQDLLRVLGNAEAAIGADGENNAAEIAGAVDPELIKGRILWMGGALTQAADHTRPLGNYLRDLIEEIVHEIYYLTRVRGRLIHRGRSEQSPDYAARRLAACVLRALNAMLFVLSTTPSQSLETIISSYIVAYERQDHRSFERQSAHSRSNVARSSRRAQRKLWITSGKQMRTARCGQSSLRIDVRSNAG